jgi:alkylresorcinol/alkylpyrone synthase
MYLKSLVNRVPEDSLTQAECWDIFVRSEAPRHLKGRSVSFVDKVLHGESGIEKRHFALPNLDQLFQLDAESLNIAFEREAPALARRALKEALERAACLPSQLDALFVCTCTGYLCPGISSHLAEQVGMRRDAFLQDIVGLGCGAAIPSLRSASYFLHAHPQARVAVVAVEICSAAFYLNDDPGVLISACLFGDGASASVWSGDRDRTGWLCNGFDLTHLPEDREILRFVNQGGKLCNRLHKSVPEKAAQAVAALFAKIDPASVDHVISHAGGRDVILAIESAMPGFPLTEAASVLRSYGNMSSPSVLFALEEHLAVRKDTSGGKLWLTSFGAGFTCHACRVSAV